MADWDRMVSPLRGWGFTFSLHPTLTGRAKYWRASGALSAKRFLRSRGSTAGKSKEREREKN